MTQVPTSNNLSDALAASDNLSRARWQIRRAVASGQMQPRRSLGTKKKGSVNVSGQMQPRGRAIKCKTANSTRRGTVPELEPLRPQKSGAAGLPIEKSKASRVKTPRPQGTAARAPECPAPSRTEMHMHCLARTWPGPEHCLRLCISWVLPARRYATPGHAHSPDRGKTPSTQRYDFVIAAPRRGPTRARIARRRVIWIA